MTTITPQSEAVTAAIAQGLRYHWCKMQFGDDLACVAQSWEDAGFVVNDNGEPIFCVGGNPVVRHLVAPIDPARDADLCEE